MPIMLCTDSRQVKPGAVFFAIPGVHADGHTFIAGAITSGAQVIVHQNPLDHQPGIIYIQTADVRQVLSYAASAWFDHPSHSLCLIGVTGTDGKSSTTYFLQQLLELSGVKCGFFSTVAYKSSSGMQANSYRQSTLEALELNEILASMRDSGLTHAVIEATSHGLSQLTCRLKHIRFHAGIFTNLSHEHLEFHGSMEQYAYDKANLFRSLSPYQGQEAFGIINDQDTWADYMAAACTGRALRYRSGTPLASHTVDLQATDLRSNAGGIDFTLHYQNQAQNTGIPLLGDFNVANVLAALLAASRLLSVSLFSLLPLLGKLKSVQGRMLSVQQGQNFTVIVDYAHTPGSFETILPSLRQATPGKLILVFGSGGERDREKRPLQGAIASRFADMLVLTNEDPRLEDEMGILQDIHAGVLQELSVIPVYCIPDRPAAVAKALAMAGAGDTVALLGKGHEQSIIHAAGKVPYDEESCARAALAALGFTKKDQ